MGARMQQALVTNDYRSILREELAARCRQNPRYSLRAFARDLQLAPSRLCEVLSGKQGLSRRVAERVAKALDFAADETERFCDMVESQHARCQRDRETARIRLTRHAMPEAAMQLQMDTFKAIADWYHFGILELILVDGFKSDAKWISRRLRITELEVQLALERLFRLGLVVRVGEDIKVNQAGGFVPGDVPSDSIKRFHAQILAQAGDALVVQKLEEREFWAQITAIDRRQLPEAKKAIREFAHRFCNKLAEAEAKDGLYCLGIQLFELGERG